MTTDRSAADERSDAGAAAIVTLCAGCGCKRDGSGKWVAAETAVAANGVLFSHGLCPACFRRLYPGMPHKDEAETPEVRA